MSVATPPIATPPGTGAGPPVDAACPLCGAALDPAQEWCLSCGAAARTRLAAPTNWRAPIVTIAVIATLALGVLAAALVKLSGGSGTTKPLPPVTRTITVAIAPTTPGALPTTTTPATPGGGLGGATAPTTPGAATPGTPTTLTPTTPTTTSGAPTATAPGTPAPGTSTKTSTGSSRANEEALRKAGFLPRTKP